MIGCVVYGCGSAITAAAKSLPVLIVGWSVLEGLGAALIMPAVVALVAIYFTLQGGQTIVALLLMAYSFVTQLFPSLALSLGRTRWVTPEGAAAGIVCGVVTVAAISLTHATVGTLFPALPVAIQELNVGIVALAVNVLVLAVVSLGTSLGTRLVTARHGPRVRAPDPPSRPA